MPTAESVMGNRTPSGRVHGPRLAVRGGWRGGCAVGAAFAATHGYLPPALRAEREERRRRRRDDALAQSGGGWWHPNLALRPYFGTFHPAALIALANAISNFCCWPLVGKGMARR